MKNGKTPARNWTRTAAWALWILGLLLLAYGAIFNTYLVLDKPLSSDAVNKGVKMMVYTEAEMVSAVSTDRVALAEDGLLKTRPDTGFCES